MSKEDNLLLDLLGKPKAMIDKEGNFVALADFDLPPDNYVFFVPVEEWKKLMKKYQISERRGYEDI